MIAIDTTEWTLDQLVSQNLTSLHQICEGKEITMACVANECARIIEASRTEGKHLARLQFRKEKL